MAEKGAKARLYDAAHMMYVEGKSLTDIEAALGVSRQTLSSWKADTLKPGDELDEWDQARQVKRSNVQRLRALFDRELSYLEGLPAGSLPPATLDGITKLGTLVQRWEAADRQSSAQSEEQRAALFLDFLRDMIAFFGEKDADALVYVETYFDDLIQWAREKHGS